MLDGRGQDPNGVDGTPKALGGHALHDAGPALLGLGVALACGFSVLAVWIAMVIPVGP